MSGLKVAFNPNSLPAGKDRYLKQSATKAPPGKTGQNLNPGLLQTCHQVTITNSVTNTRYNLKQALYVP